MAAFTSQVSIVLLLLISSMTFYGTMCNVQNVVRCNEKDQRILSTFKQGIVDPTNRLSTWSTEEDCCAWMEVLCDNITGRVTKLNLVSHRFDLSDALQGEINLSLLLELEFLSYLVLSFNDFVAIVPPIHVSAATVQENQSLVTPSYPIANFSNLLHLDLSFNYRLRIDNLAWLPRLSSLEYLSLSEVDLHKETHWLQFIAVLPSLSELHLYNCQLTNINQPLHHVNFSSLVTLDLSSNHFSSELPHWLFNLSSNISYLDLSWNNFNGQVSTGLINLRNLVHLDLSFNFLSGSIPDSLGQHEHLQFLHLSQNLFNGSIPSSLGNLSSLIDLDISSNSLSGNLPDSLGQLFNLKSLVVGNNSYSGVLSQTIFSKLSNLETLDLSSTLFEFDLDPHWIPPFQLSRIDLSNTIQGPNFPAWLYTQRSLQTLEISSSGISSVSGDDMFWSFVATINVLSLSNNSISGDISNVSLNSQYIYLDHNNFTGGLPHISTNANHVDVSHNCFSGTVFPLFCPNISRVGLMYMDISYNLLTGALPDCWLNWTYVYYVSVGSNKLVGEVPLDLSNLTFLKFIDLEENEFSGTIPIWMPQSLEVMILRFNKFVGNIPPQLCNLSSLRVLLMDHNELSGSIPPCVYNITDMAAYDARQSGYKPFLYNFLTKGQDLEYRYDGLSRAIDLSANNLSGEIPQELFSLIQVQSLNLSHNHLTGTMPNTIGNMQNLESFDVSNNQLYGEIPQSMSGMSFLSHLNISYNNFSGQIPLGTQLQSFDASSYMGNPGLCGAPLTKNCTEEENPENAKQHAGNEDVDPFRESLYLGMGVGFAVGFWTICGSLFLNRTWRHTYIRFLDRIIDHFYVTVMIKFNRFRRM